MIFLTIAMITSLFVLGCQSQTTSNEITTERTTYANTEETTENLTTVETTKIEFTQKYPNEPFIIRKYQDGVEIIAYIGSESSVEVPNELNGFPVLKIGNYAFFENLIVEHIILPNNVLEIGDNAFSGASNLMTIRLPMTITTFGENIFINCTSLTEINMEEGNPNYYSLDGILYYQNNSSTTQLSFNPYNLEEGIDNSELVFYPQGKTDTSYQIPEGIEVIHKYAFSSNQYLTEVIIPSSVVEIQIGAFMNCSNLETLNIPQSVEYIPDYMCYNCSSLTNLGLSEGNLEIGRSAFHNCTSLSSLTFPNSLTFIELEAFTNIGGIQQIHLNDGLLIEGGSIFSSNQSFTSYSINLTNTDYQVIDGVLYSYDLSTLVSYPSGKIGTTYEVNSLTTEIGNGAFQGNYFLEEVTFAGLVNTIGGYAFSYCRSLTSFEIPKNVENLSMNTFYNSIEIEEYTVDPDNLYFEAINGVIYSENLQTLYFYPPAKTDTLFSIPNTTTVIESLAFFNNQHIVNLIVPQSLSTIGGGVFSSMISLDEITVEQGNISFASIDGVLYSADLSVLYAFPSGKNVVTFNIPASVTTISYGAFQGQQYIEYLIIPNTVVDIYSHTFRECPNLEWLVIPNSVTFIQGKLFMGSENVTIYFDGLEPNYDFYHTWNLESRPYYYMREWKYNIDNVPELKVFDPNEAEIALIIDNSMNPSYNIEAWNFIYWYAETTLLSYASYDEGSILASIQAAVNNGARIIICPGYIFETTIYDIQNDYPNVSFLLLDGEPHSVDNSVYLTADNVHNILYQEEQAGFLAGYAAVKDGYRNLGFIGSMESTNIKEYGYGFIQGAEYAANELGLAAGSINIRFDYADDMLPSLQLETQMDSWYANGTEVIFACGGRIFESVITAAEKTTNGKVIVVETDQSFDSDRILALVVKGLGSSIEYTLYRFYDNNMKWPLNMAGETDLMGVGRIEMGISTADTAWGFTNFTITEYELFYYELGLGTVTVSSIIDNFPTVYCVSIILN